MLTQDVAALRCEGSEKFLDRHGIAVFTDEIGKEAKRFRPIESRLQFCAGLGYKEAGVRTDETGKLNLKLKLAAWSIVLVKQMDK